MQLMPPARDMERAFLAGDAAYDGLFWAGVTTTGIYCRPSCPARKPAAAHLRYFPSCNEATAAGYRPCRRCDPTGALGAAPDWIQPVLRHLDSDPSPRLTDSDLDSMGLDAGRANRWFRKHLGLTVAEYGRSRRLQVAQERLAAGEALDHVALDSGFESHSGFRDAFVRQYGVPPGQADGADAILEHTIPSPLGPLRLGATRDGLCLLEFPDPIRIDAAHRGLDRWLGLPFVPGRNAHIDRAIVELDEYFAGRRRDFTVPLVAPGTAFERQVWAALGTIPYGVTWSYAELARSVGNPDAQRAVGMANGRNRIALLIPCHRVVNTGGALGGYGGGLWRKHWLLELERRPR